MRTGPGFTAGSRRVRIAAVAIAVALGAACSGPDESEPSAERSESLINGGGPVLDGATLDGAVGEPARPMSGFAEHACAVVLDWTYELVAVVNGFTTQSREAAGPDERRGQYLDAFDTALALTDQLGSILGSGPAPDAPAALGVIADAVRRARDELAGARADAAALPTSDYEVRRVRSGKLFVASEKARSLVFGGLDRAATDHDLQELLAPCGRPQYPDT